MRIMIIDDEYSFVVKLKDSLYHSFVMMFDYTEYDLYHNPASIDYSVEYDFAFIDIDMPEENGIIVAEKINRYNPKTKIVFVSSHTNLIHNTLIVNPFYFIRKPCFKDDLDTLIKLINNKIKKMATILLKYDDEYSRISIKDIIYVESDSHRLKIYVKDRIYYDNRTLINMLEELLEHGFVRIHRSYIINLEYLTKIKGDNIELNHSVWIKVGRYYKEDFIRVYKEALLIW